MFSENNDSFSVNFIVKFLTVKYHLKYLFVISGESIEVKTCKIRIIRKIYKARNTQNLTKVKSAEGRKNVRLTC